ncbi:MAG: bifunctional phosphoribosylaminoimidazolecarboxamide formyltransferase/IMP cyclohydrolase [Pseudomonadota bacterium]
MSDVLPVRRAVLSVSDKDGLVEFAKALAAAGVELVSTGGTFRALSEAGVAVTEVAALTGFPEMLDGRVKTLHPVVHGGLLADRSKAEHMAALDAAGIGPIDLLVSNLYPFEAALAAGKSPAELVETIDVGGPTMTRAAAKNFAAVAVVVEAADYAAVAAEVATGGTTLAMRRRLAAKAFARLAAYDATVASWMAEATAADDVAVDHTAWGAVGGRKTGELRYGENPHQSAAFYASGRGGVAGARVMQGKALSYNNIADADAAWAAAAEFRDDVAAVIVKHANPCGIAVRGTLAEAYEAARIADPVSAFGGVVALTRPLDEATAEAIGAIFTEVIMAPGASDGALAKLAGKPNVRMLLSNDLPPLSGQMVRSVAGGLLIQDLDAGVLGDARVVTKRAPTDAEWGDLRFAWKAVKHVKSNTIVYVKDRVTVGIGAGQMSRVDAARIGASKAADAARDAGEPMTRTQGSVAASDAFFPFADGLEELVKAGASAVIQPGGSRRDDEVIAAADKAGIAMVMTGMRHFRH